MDTTFQPQGAHQPQPKNWLVESILVTIFCCLPFGIAGIVFASQVNNKYNQGDYAGALHSSKEAAKWTKIGLWIGLGWVILCIIFMFFFGGLALMGIGAASQDNY